MTKTMPSFDGSGPGFTLHIEPGAFRGADMIGHL